jgi:hypothetical protein
MTKREKWSLLSAGVVVASLILVPTAGAMPTCQDAGGTVRCETNGSVSIKAVPQSRAPHVGEINPPRRGVIWSW